MKDLKTPESQALAALTAIFQKLEDARLEQMRAERIAAREKALREKVEEERQKAWEAAHNNAQNAKIIQECKDRMRRMDGRSSCTHTFKKDYNGPFIRLICGECGMKLKYGSTIEEDS